MGNSLFAAAHKQDDGKKTIRQASTHLIPRLPVGETFRQPLAKTAEVDSVSSVSEDDSESEKEIDESSGVMISNPALAKSKAISYGNSSRMGYRGSLRQGGQRYPSTSYSTLQIVHSSKDAETANLLILECRAYLQRKLLSSTLANFDPSRHLGLRRIEEDILTDLGKSPATRLKSRKGKRLGPSKTSNAGQYLSWSSFAAGTKDAITGESTSTFIPRSYDVNATDKHLPL